MPNKYPALKIEGDIGKAGEGLYDKMNGVGAHEVIIESPNHKDTLSTISVKQFEEVLWAYRDRIVDLKRDVRLRYALLFKNHGEAAEASLEHSHSQLIALPIVPKESPKNSTAASNTSAQRTLRLLRHSKTEIMQGIRVVTENQDFLAVTPYAPKAPFEVWTTAEVPRIQLRKLSETPL